MAWDSAKAAKTSRYCVNPAKCQHKPDKGNNHPLFLRVLVSHSGPSEGIENAETSTLLIEFSESFI
jgi:hypothetical protein